MEENKNDNRVREGFGLTEWVSREHAAMYYENSAERRAYADKLIKEERKRNDKRTVVFSLFGLIFSFVLGIGSVFSVVGLIRADFLLKKYESKTLRRAKILSITGLIINALIIVALLIFIVRTFPFQS